MHVWITIVLLRVVGVDVAICFARIVPMVMTINFVKNAMGASVVIALKSLLSVISVKKGTVKNIQISSYVVGLVANLGVRVRLVRKIIFKISVQLVIHKYAQIVQKI